MAVKVIITVVNAPADPPQGQLISGSINVSLVSDYESPMSFQYIMSASFNEKRSREAGIRRALKKVEELGNQIAEGARKAMQERPIGS